MPAGRRHLHRFRFEWIAQFHSVKPLLVFSGARQIGYLNCADASCFLASMTTHTKKLLFWLAMSSLANACTYTNPGGGTQTLEVQALLHYNTQSVAGATSPITKVQILVQKNGAAVANPTITLMDADTNQTYTIAGSGGGSTFNSQIPGYHRRMSLSVTAGSDNLQAHLEGPGPFTLSSPEEGAAISQSGGLNVAWQTDDGVKADQVTVLLLPANASNTGHDTGGFQFPSSDLGLGPQMVSVTRSSMVVPAGGTGQSSFQSDYEVDVKFNVGG
jgi:hypothetical protein